VQSTNHHYRFLTDNDRDELYSAFQKAFSDYQVDMRMSRAQFDYRLLRDGIDFSKSLGAFHENELIGFCISGVGTWKGEQTIYDAGTGVVPEHRQHGIGKEMFSFMLPRLKEAGFSRYLLEVITSNEPAVNLYRKLGFIDTRSLMVFRSKNPLENFKTSGADVRETSVPDWNLYKTFWDFDPSWQNSVEATKRTAEYNVVLEAYKNNRCVGYGVVSRNSGNLFQLAIDKQHRRRGFGSSLLIELQRRVVTNQPLKVNNIDEASKESLSFYEWCGFQLTLAQYELIKSL
jgi:ribosomal protein S18 acetylase RimI-like enzyme